jgi:hypothetical protein
MASRSVSSFVSRDLDPRLSDAVITDSTASLNTPSPASLKRRARPYAVDSTEFSSSRH